jgi:hypothetical protein
MWLMSYLDGTFFFSELFEMTSLESLSLAFDSGGLVSRALARPTHKEKRREKSNSHTPALRAQTLDFQGSALGEDGMSAPIR